MRKNLLVIGIVVIALLVGASAAFAEGARDQVYGVHFPNVGEGELYSRSSLIERPDLGPVPLPEPQPTAPPPAVTIKGPSVSGSSATALSSGINQVMMTSRGDAMSSPRQRADREIRRVIRRLN